MNGGYQPEAEKLREQQHLHFLCSSGPWEVPGTGLDVEGYSCISEPGAGTCCMIWKFRIGVGVGAGTGCKSRGWGEMLSFHIACLSSVWPRRESMTGPSFGVLSCLASGVCHCVEGMTCYVTE